MALIRPTIRNTSALRSVRQNYFEIEYDLPNIDMRYLEVFVYGNVLYVSGRFEPEEGEERARPQTFDLQLKLTEEVYAEDGEARYTKYGNLVITLPKVELSRRNKRISIQVKR